MKRILLLLLLYLADHYVIVAQQSSPETLAELTVIGTVYDEDTRKPVAASVVVAMKDFDPLVVNTDATGRFAVGIPTPSQCSIMAKAEGFETSEHMYFFQKVEPDSVLRLGLYLIPREKVKLEGQLLSSKDSKPLNCQLKMHLNSDFSSGETDEMFSGVYAKALTSFGWYILEFSAQGFLPVSDTLWVVNSHRRTIHKDFQLNPIEIGLTVRMENVYFNFGEATLRPESYNALNKIRDLFIKNSSLQFEIAGHTDSEGPEQYNLQLSQSRAQAIADYLIDKGVSPSQLIVRGYGETRPIDSNLTPTGKFNNRRVEFIVAANSNQ